MSRCGYEPGKPILKNLDLRLDPDDRIALLGSNGNGKSTFVKLLAEQPGADGPATCATPPRSRVGCFAQHQTEELDLEATPIDGDGARRTRTSPPDKRRAHLGRFGFGPDQVNTQGRLALRRREGAPAAGPR